MTKCILSRQTTSAFCVCIMLFLLQLPPLATMRQAAASPQIFQFFGRICLNVHELREDHKSTIRDDLAEAIARPLNASAKRRNRNMVVSARESCLSPDNEGYSRQMMVELYAKRQVIQLDGKTQYLTIVGGSSPNARGELSEYELQPIVLITIRTFLKLVSCAPSRISSRERL
jgi:hypothetical protein